MSNETMSQVEETMLEAVRTGNIEEIQKIAEIYSLHLSNKWNGGFRLLVQALETKQYKIAKSLIDLNASLTFKDESAILLAVCDERAWDIFTKVLDRLSPTDLNKADPATGRTALHEACAWCNLDAVETLLDRGVDYRLLDHQENTPVHLIGSARAYSDQTLHSGSEIARAFDKRDKLSWYTNISRDRRNFFISSAKTGDFLLFSYLTNPDDDLSHLCAGDKEKKTALYYAASRGSFEIVELIFKKYSVLKKSKGLYRDGVSPPQDKLAFEVALSNLAIAPDDRKFDFERTCDYFIEYKCEIDQSKLVECSLIAAKTGSIACMKALNRAGLDFNADLKLPKRRELLLGVVKYGKLDMVSYIISTLDLKSIYSETWRATELFVEALKRNDLLILELLIREEFLSVLSSNQSSELLHFAIENLCTLDIIELLLKQTSANINHVNPQTGKTALRRAIELNSLKVASFLLKSGADIHLEPRLFLQAFLQELKFAKLLKNPVEPRKMLSFLLERGYDVNAKDDESRTALHYAAEAGIYVEYLLDCGAHASLNVTDKHNNTPLSLSLQAGQHEVARLLLEQGADPNIPDQNSRIGLHYACRAGMNFDLFLEKTRDINAVDSDGDTPLIISILVFEYRWVRKLLEMGANVNTKNDECKTALHYAVEFQNHVELLIRHGAEVDANDGQNTPLHLAVEKGNYVAAWVLIDAGADLNIAQKPSGDTPLHIILRAGKFEMFESILIRNAHRIDASISNKDGKLPVDLIEKGRLADMRTLLEELGAKVTEEAICLHSKSREMLLIIKSYLQKLELIGYEVTKSKVLDAVQLADGFAEHLEVELNLMKGYKLHDQFTAFDILTDMSVDPSYLKNEEVIERLRSFDYVIEFPLYGKIMRQKIVLDAKCSDLFSDAITTLAEVLRRSSFKVPRLPDDVLRKILSYLDRRGVESFRGEGRAALIKS